MKSYGSVSNPAKHSRIITRSLSIFPIKTKYNNSYRNLPRIPPIALRTTNMNDIITKKNIVGLLLDP